jgi:hypothetical protein
MEPPGMLPTKKTSEIRLTPSIRKSWKTRPGKIQAGIKLIPGIPEH